MRFIAYVDMDAFYVSCEIRDRPDLADRPVIVGRAPTGPESRGVVLSASYAARKFGVRSAQPVVQAARRCPEAVWVPPDFEKYGRAAGEVRALLREEVSAIVPLSIDEAAMAVDLGSTAEVEAWARRQQDRLRDRLGLPSSWGASPYAVVAKIASDAAKPGGVRVVPAEETAAFLAPLPVRAIPGIGPKSSERLSAGGIGTVEALAKAPLGAVRRVLGRFGDSVQALARGRPPPELADLPADREARQRSLDRTFERDTRDGSEIREQLTEMAGELGGLLEKEGLRYQNVVVRLRWEDFTQLQRGRTLPAAQTTAASLAAEAVRLAGELLERERAGRDRAVRRVSLSVAGLSPRRGRQPSLEEFVAPSTSA
jgi:DNA polymerase-4